MRFRSDLTFTGADFDLTGTQSDMYFSLDLNGPLTQQVELYVAS